MRLSTMPELLVNEDFMSSAFSCPFLVVEGGGNNNEY